MAYFNFLGLPIELRLNVYEHLFSISNLKHQRCATPNLPRNPYFITATTGILSTCRGIYEEARPVFMKQTSLEVWYDVDMPPGIYPQLRSALTYGRDVKICVYLTQLYLSPRSTSTANVVGALRRFTELINRAHEQSSRVPNIKLRLRFDVHQDVELAKMRMVNRFSLFDNRQIFHDQQVFLGSTLPNQWHHPHMRYVAEFLQCQLLYFVEKMKERLQKFPSIALTTNLEEHPHLKFRQVDAQTATWLDVLTGTNGFVALRDTNSNRLKDVEIGQL